MNLQEHRLEYYRKALKIQSCGLDEQALLGRMHQLVERATHLRDIVQSFTSFFYLIKS